MGKDKLICITKNDWHYKLIKFTWGIDPSMFKNLCPYFWLTIASIFCCLFKALYVFLRELWYAFDRFDQRNYERRLSRAQIFYEYACLYGIRYIESRGEDIKYYKRVHEKLRNKDKDQFLKRLGLTEKEVKGFEVDFDKDISIREEQKAIYKEKRKLCEQKKQREEERVKEIMYTIANVFKFLFKSGLVVASCFLGSLICWCITNVICWVVDTGEGVNILKALGNIVGFAFGGLVFGEFAEKFENDWKKNLGNLRFKEYLYVIPFLILYLPLRILFKTIIWNIIYYVLYKFLWGTIIVGIAVGFKEGFTEFGGIFGDYMNASYSDYCPMINWDKKEK